MHAQSDPSDSDRDRRALIDEYQILGSRPPRDLQALVEIAAQVCEVPSAAINLITEDAQHQVATAGFDPSVCARSDSMCAAVLTDPAPVVVPDASRDERFRDNPFVTGAIGHARFYASAPLVTPGGVTVGRLCVFDDEVRRLDSHQEEALVLLAERVVDVLELRLRARQLEESLAELTRTRDELTRSNDLLAQFAGQVSHDLLNPLTAIITSAELLAHEPAVADDPELAQLATNAADAGRRMSGMIEQILKHARLGSELEVADVDLDIVVADVVTDLAPLRAATGGSVEVGPLGRVRGDEKQLYSVLLNLVSNGLKFGRPGIPPGVEVRAERDAHLVRLRVSDNGQGIPKEERERSFRLFARGRSHVEGSGIGLATVRRIVEVHHGRVDLHNGPDGGTVVVVELPA